MNAKNIISGALVVVVGLLVYNIVVRPLLAKANITA